MLALAICLALSAPEVFAASQGYEDPSRVAADMASQNMTSAQNVQKLAVLVLLVRILFVG